jgi:hypothetical protein
MIWIAPTATDTDTVALEKRLRDAADQFRPKKCDVRGPGCKVQSVRRSTFRIRRLRGLPYTEARLHYVLNRPEGEIKHGGRRLGCHALVGTN